MFFVCSSEACIISCWFFSESLFLTTFSGKLSLLVKSKMNKNPLLVACDVYRPAAINQLGVLGDQVGVDVYKELENKNPVDIAKNAIKHAKKNGHNVV